MKTSLTSVKLKQHFTYSWWIYLLIIAIGIGLVDILYTVSAYRPPREKTIGFYVYGYMDDQKLTEYMDHVRETEMSDMEELLPRLILVDNAYGPMQLSTYFAAGEGDLYLLPREEFISYAFEGVLLPLENDPELISLFDSAGVNLQNGWRRTTETGETHLYGIPQDKLPGLMKYAYAQDGYLCLVATGRNQENAAKFMRILCRDMIIVPADAEPSPAAEK
ncbi:MAG: hypothetical protein K6F61_12100 [Clostridiales bacterium]|nr:hypothetical protein [Clostridiales bacterium]